jgi:hypothetical protein
MTARLLSNKGSALLGRAPQAHLRVTLYGSVHCAVHPDLQPNQNMARVRWWMQESRKLLPPATREDVTGNLSREHVKHKYKRPGCRIQKDDRKLLNLFW